MLFLSCLCLWYNNKKKFSQVLSLWTYENRMEFNFFLFFFFCVFELVSPLLVAKVYMFHSTGNVVISVIILMSLLLLPLQRRHYTSTPYITSKFCIIATCVIGDLQCFNQIQFVRMFIKSPFTWNVTHQVQQLEQTNC